MNTNFKTENVVYVVVGMLAAALLLFVAIPLLSTEKIFDTAKGTSLGVLVVHADDGGAEGGAGGGGGAGDGGGSGSDGSGADGGATGGASGGGGCCGGEPGASTDGGGVGDFGGSEVTVAYVPPQPQMTGSISATVGACVPGVAKRYVDISWNTQNAQITVAQSAGGQYGGGINLISPTSNNSGSLRLEVSAGAYVFAVAGHNTSWVTLQNVHRVITTDDCVPQTQINWTPYCTGADDPNGNKWQWWEKSNTNPIQYRFLRAGDGTCVPPVIPTPQMTGSISATVGACVPGVAKRYVDVSWNTQNAQLSVVQMVSANFGGNLFTPTANTSGTLNLEFPTGAYKFGIVGGRDGSWVTFKNADLLLNADDCVSTTVTWTPYCTGADDPNGNKWQWWEKSNTNPIQYRFLRAGDGTCLPPAQLFCPSGTTGTFPNCVVINNNNTNTNNNTNNNNNVITINNPAPQTQIIYRDRDSRSRSSSRSDYRYNDYGACTITVSPNVVAYGQATTLSWSSNSGSSGWIEGVGNVSAYGSMQTTPTRSGVYTGRFVGNNGQTITCSAYVTVSGAYVPPAYNTPYVSLASVPYTGLELGPYGTVIYWSFLILWCLFAAYLVAVKKIQNNIANWFAGKRSASSHTRVAHEAHAAHAVASHEDTPAHVYREDAVDSFIAQQLKLVQR